MKSQRTIFGRIPTKATKSGAAGHNLTPRQVPQLSAVPCEEVEEPLECTSAMNLSTSEERYRRRGQRDTESWESSPVGTPHLDGREVEMSFILEQVRDALKKVEDDRRGKTLLQEFLFKMTGFIATMIHVHPPVQYMAICRQLVNDAINHCHTYAQPDPQLQRQQVAPRQINPMVQLWNHSEQLSSRPQPQQMRMAAQPQFNAGQRQDTDFQPTGSVLSAIATDYSDQGVSSRGASPEPREGFFRDMGNE
ncbi:uncharacterized protein LOC129709584 [Leucoraja erinacea]|uniref:uncharacterized protein LOC129709584 n=1 Tax=Leucoraja erinaceus TaxID=7782 RepID=UPI00245813EB|nr:uncharacterized protein LOC129709584 [Leucoraja erinacea]